MFLSDMSRNCQYLNANKLANTISHHIFICRRNHTKKHRKESSGQDKSGNEALTTAPANRQSRNDNNTNAKYNNAKLYTKSDNTRQNYREYRRRKLEKSTQWIQCVHS